MRIRTIKPEFWTSENIGRLSRDARLLFIGLWSLADDSGRLRGALPYLSGQLFPYDSDTTVGVVGGWLEELIKLGMVRRYEVDGSTYLDIPKWEIHQKIEKKSRSKYPAFDEGSPTIPLPVGEGSALDQGSGNREQGGEREVEADSAGGGADHLLAPAGPIPQASADLPGHTAPIDWYAWRRSHPSIYVNGSGEDGSAQDWRALFGDIGPEVMDVAYARLDAKKTGKTIGYRVFCEWINKNTRRES